MTVLALPLQVTTRLQCERQHRVLGRRNGTISCKLYPLTSLVSIKCCKSAPALTERAQERTLGFRGLRWLGEGTGAGEKPSVLNAESPFPIGLCQPQDASCLWSQVGTCRGLSKTLLSMEVGFTWML